MTQVEWAGYLASQISVLLNEGMMLQEQVRVLSEENAQLRAKIQNEDDRLSDNITGEE